MSREKRTSSCAVLLLLCTVLVLSGTTNETKKDSSTCGLQCKVSPGKTETKCTLTTDLLKMNCSRKVYSNILQNVTSLDLSNNNLTQVPTWMFSFCKSLTNLSLAQNNIKTIEYGTFRNLTNLTSLSLAQNNIKTIGYGTFRDLRNLTSLNLSFNDLREWRIEGNIELQSLNYLDVTGNEQWTPSKQLLQLKTLATVQGVTLSKYCKNCSLAKKKSDAAEDSLTSQSCYGKWLSSPSQWRWHDLIQYGKALDFIKLGFWPTCLCDDACSTHQHVLPFYQAFYDVTIKASFSLYATGSVALLVNITVVLVILCHKSLRGNLAVRLVLNIALCDVLVGLVSLLLGRYSSLTMSIESLHDLLEGKRYDVVSKIKTYRNIMGPILTCAVVSQVFGSFILTLEKFLKIVFAMKPDIRIGKCGVMLFLFLSWSFSLTFAVLPAFDVGRMSYNVLVDGTPLPTDPHTFLGVEVKTTVGIAAGSQIVLIIIQLTSFVLYLPIFIVSKRSGASVGIKREATIARKIALLVFTNLIFFTIPVMLGVFHVQLWYKLRDMMQNRQDYRLIEAQWLVFFISFTPVLCVSVNSVLNPFLYALRHPKIKQQLRTILCRCRNVLSECFAALRLHPPCCHSNAGQPGNDIEIN